MFKKIIAYLFLFYLFVAIILSLSGVTSVDLMNSANTFFRSIVQRFNNWGKVEIPTIPRIATFKSQGWLIVLNAIIFLVNMLITITNLAITIMNFILQLFEFIAAFVTIILNIDKWFSLIVPTMIM